MSQVDGTIMWLFCNIVFAAAFLPSSKSLNISPLLCLGQYYILLSCFLLDKKKYILFRPSPTSYWVEISGQMKDIFCSINTKYVCYILSICMMNILFHIISHSKYRVWIFHNFLAILQKIYKYKYFAYWKHY